MRPWRKRQFAGFGPDSLVDRPEWIYGAHHISIGRGVVILSGARLSTEVSSWESPEPSLVIRDGAMFRTGLTISATSHVLIEENVLGAAWVSIIDSDHTITQEDVNPLFNPSESTPIRVGAGSWLGERVTVLRGSDIGRKCIIGAHSVVRGKIPDYSVATGIPAKVVSSTLEPS